MRQGINERMILGGITCLPNFRHKKRNFPPFSCVEIIMILDLVRQRLLFSFPGLSEPLSLDS